MNQATVDALVDTTNATLLINPLDLFLGGSFNVNEGYGLRKAI